MYLQISFLCLLSSVALVVGQPTMIQTIRYDVPPPSTTDIALEIIIATNGATISTVEILSLVSAADASNDCTYTYSSLTGPIAGVGRIVLQIVPATVMFTTPGKETCPVTGSAVDGVFRFRLRLRETQGANSMGDSTFLIETTGSNQVDISVLPQPQVNVNVVNLQTGNYSFGLGVWDFGNTPISNANLGSAVKLVFTMTIDPYQDRLAFVGADVHSCYMDRDNTFSNSPIKLTGQDGCVTGNPIITGNGGVEKNDALSEYQTPTVYLFVAESPSFGVRGFANEPQVFFKCYFTPCFNDTGNTCGVNNCGAPTVRKKREISETDAVTTSITINKPKPAEKQCTCPDPTLWYGSLGGLGVLAATGFVVMITLFLDLQRSRKLSSSSQSTMRSGERRAPSTSSRSVPASTGSLKNCRS